MPHKQMQLADGTIVKLSKRRNSRSIRMTIGRNGDVLVTLPSWAPYAAAISFVRSREDWIAAHRQAPTNLLDGHSIGKAHRLRFEPARDTDKVSTRLKDTEIIIRYPAQQSIESPEVQAAAERASLRALRTQAEHLLPQRLALLAQTHNLTYQSVSVKRLKGRWGSCDQHQNIVLNIFLMELPWDLIDYVLLHELTHTQVLKHGPDFWAAMATVLPDVQLKRKQIKSYQPIFRSSAPQRNMP